MLDSESNCKLRGSTCEVGMRLLAALLALAETGAITKPDGTCGYQCKADADCGACGPSSAGRCACPNGADVPFAETSCTCVAATPGAPLEPAADVKDSTWPRKWTAEVDTWTYGDFSSATTMAHGKFYYDADLQRTRADWHPYINGKDAQQVWIADLAGGSSRYYVKSGLICIYFSITDPGQGKYLVGVEKIDWMQQCSQGGWAKYVGREQVLVDGVEEWVDHFSCRLDYEAANQSITFQNWHSLGLGSVPKGLPLRVTGGNSAPNSKKGSPRLNTVWYSSFVTGDSATSSADFKKPNFGACIPVGQEELQEFFGHSPSHHHAFSPDFHRRAHFMAHRKPGHEDLMRAKRATPRDAFRGDSFKQTMQKLNSILAREPGLQTMPCSNMSLSQLHAVQRTLFDARAPALDKVYQDLNDTRRMVHSSLDDLKAEHSKHLELDAARPDLALKARSGVCHELVMWYTHHLSAEAKEEVKKMLVLPLLPEVQHEEPVDADPDSHTVHQRYSQQISCAICHVTPTSPRDFTISV